MHRMHVRKGRRLPPGSAPGIFNIPDDALKPRVIIHSFSDDSYDEKEVFNFQGIITQLETFKDKIHWIDIRGFGDRPFFEQLSKYFSIHKLQMEDVFNVYQRPKLEEHSHYLFMISRCIREEVHGLINDQLSLFLGKNYVMTISERYEDILDPLRERLRDGKGFLRKHGSDYLAYSIMDVALDNFYPILEKTGDHLDDLQEQLIEEPSRTALNKLLLIKRDLILLRRAVWSERDKLNDLLRSGFPALSDSSKPFFRDSYDHSVQVLDLIEIYREVTASLMDVYMSSVSNKLNQVMKVLTIISTVFIPLTFVVGLYGMNFSRFDPATHSVLPWNMPELYMPYGYPVVLAVMISIVLGMIMFFYRKGWLGKN